MKADRTCAVAAAAAHDLNNELTIIVNSASWAMLTLEPGHPARPFLHDLLGSAQRCVWKASGLLNYTARRPVRPGDAVVERLPDSE
jgi:hypothetical protein